MRVGDGAPAIGRSLPTGGDFAKTGGRDRGGLLETTARPTPYPAAGRSRTPLPGPAPARSAPGRVPRVELRRDSTRVVHNPRSEAGAPEPGLTSHEGPSSHPRLPDARRHGVRRLRPAPPPPALPPSRGRRTGGAEGIRAPSTASLAGFPGASEGREGERGRRRGGAPSAIPPPARDLHWNHLPAAIHRKHPNADVRHRSTSLT